MEQTARVHLLFRGAAEVTKKLRTGALLCEIMAGGISLVTILAKPTDSAVWLPLAILLLALIGTALRSYSSSANGFSQRCRRISLRAFCAGKDVDRRTVALLDDDTPPFVEAASARLPAKSMNEYYEPTTPPGPMRQAELYAHSAFYTWRLLRIQAWLIFAVAMLFLVACGILIYHLAAQPQAQMDRHAMLEAVCTVVLLVFTVKGFGAWWEAYNSYDEIRSIENALLEKPTGEALKDLLDSYDIERAAGANPLTPIYSFRRNMLSGKWNDRRKTIVGEAAQTPTSITGDA